MDGVVCGHIHRAAVSEHSDVAYYNTGDWVESWTAIVEDSRGHLELLHWASATELLPAAVPIRDAA